jgi:hypothetical protein
VIGGVRGCLPFFSGRPDPQDHHSPADRGRRRSDPGHHREDLERHHKALNSLTGASRFGATTIVGLGANECAVGPGRLERVAATLGLLERMALDPGAVQHPLEQRARLRASPLKDGAELAGARDEPGLQPLAVQRNDPSRLNESGQLPRDRPLAVLFGLQFAQERFRRLPRLEGIEQVPDALLRAGEIALQPYAPFAEVAVAALRLSRSRISRRRLTTMWCQRVGRAGAPGGPGAHGLTMKTAGRRRETRPAAIS